MPERSRPASPRRLRRLVPACSGGLAALLVAASLPGCGGGSATPTGTYTTNIPAPPTPIGKVEGGTWTLALERNGSFSIQQGTETSLGVGKGSYVKGTTFVINP
ncbi:MAG TPA: hypothetical protein VGX51_10040, partial [Solirubrobacteraceae bacterium]|nr:hypothetical protein [Solirubrobacteraceae bacterium]